MFVIRRKAGESVRIGNEILVSVLEISGSRVKLGFTAPADLVVVRSEVLQAREQNRAAAQSMPSRENLRNWASTILKQNILPE